MRGGPLHRSLSLALLGAAAAYIVLAASFFPDAQGRLGDDYEYFLPLLLAGKYWIAGNGLLAVPRFTPAFCGGVPLLANPQAIFYSLPQLLSLALDPVASILATTLIFAGLGGAGTYALMRGRYDTSRAAASLAAIIFLFNGFLLTRMAIGHLTYHVVGLLPFLCYVLLTPLPRARPAPYLRRAAGPTALAAAMLCYVVYAGAANIAVPFGMTAVIAWLIQGLRRKPTASFWLIGAGAALIAVAASAAKLAPAAVFLAHFPRASAVRLFDNPIALAYSLFTGLFLPMLLPNKVGVGLRHEMELGVGLVPLLLMIAGGFAAFHRGRTIDRLRRLDACRAGLIVAIVALLAVPLWLNYGDAEHAAFLKSLPYLGSNVLLVRWFLIYLLPLAIASGLLLDGLFRQAAWKDAAALAGIVLTVGLAFAERSHPFPHPYDPAAILAADRDLGISGAVPPISRIGRSTATADNRQRNDGLASGMSSLPCYEPIFGYELGNFPPGLEAGPIAPGDGGRHLRNPACFIYGRDNGCAPGDRFRADQADEEAAFARYKGFHYLVPLWQEWADRASLAGLAVILFGLGAAVAPGLRDRLGR